MVIHDIKPNWLRKLLVIVLFGWFTAVMMVMLWIMLSIAAAAYSGYNTVMWWATDYVRNVWKGNNIPDKYKPFDLGH